jgi:hypothetical protein
MVLLKIQRDCKFLRAFFKGDMEDLSHADYDILENESEEILSSTIDYDWQEFVIPESALENEE